MSAPDVQPVRDDVIAVVLDSAISDDRAHIITDMDQKVAWLNAAAGEVLRHDPALRLHASHLVAEGLRAQQALTTAIAESVNGPIEAIIPFAQQRGCYLLRVRRAGSANHWLHIGVTTDQAIGPPRYFDLSLVFGLTQTEKKTALLMLGGSSAIDVAQASGVSIDTVRSHIRAIYSKMGVASREQFFARAAVFRII